MDNIAAESIIEGTVEAVEANFVNEVNEDEASAQHISDEIITGDINDVEGQGEATEMEQSGQTDQDDIIIAEAVVVTQYSCKFCNRRFDTIDKVKNHYLQRHDKLVATPEKSINNNVINALPAKQNNEQPTNEQTIENNTDSQSVAPAFKKPKLEPRTTKKSGRPSLAQQQACILKVVSNKNEETNNKRKRGRKPSGIERRFPCDWPGCNYIARHSVHLKDHKRTHTGEKPYRCNWPDCGLGFVQGSALKTHLRTHTGEKPYPCEWPGCSLRFSQKNNVKIHMRTHTGEKPYACDWPGCEWRFAIKGNLDDHKRVHAGEKFFVCDWPGCSRSYTQNSHLRRHQLVHMEDKPFACDWPGCNYRSVRSCDVQNHKVTHTGEKKYICDWPNCGKGFSRSHHLKRHNAIHTTTAINVSN